MEHHDNNLANFVVLLPIFASWITVQDIALLDSAMCNTANRTKFLDHLMLDTVEFIDRAGIRQIHQFLLWTEKKQLTITSITVIYQESEEPNTVFTAIYDIWNYNALVLLTGSQSKLNHSLTCLFIQVERDDFIFPSLQNLTALTSLHINGYNFEVSSDVCELLGLNDTLLELSLTGRCQGISYDAIQNILSNCTQLTTLEVTQTPSVFHDRTSAEKDFEEVAVCPALTTLNLEDSGRLWDGTFVSIIERCPSLRTINISFCNVLTDISLELIARHCPLLTDLNCRNCDSLTAAGLTAIASSTSALKSLDMSNNWAMATNTLLRSLANSSCGLTELRLSDCYLVTDTGMKSVAEKCHKLRALQVDWCAKLTDDSMLALATHCTELVSVSLGGCCNVFSVGALLRACRHVTSLKLFKCNQISDQIVSDFAVHATALTELDLSDCTLVGETALLALAEHCRHLKHLLLSHCPLVNDTGVIAVATHCYGLSTLDLEECCKITYDALESVNRLCVQLLVLKIHTLQVDVSIDDLHYIR